MEEGEDGSGSAGLILRNSEIGVDPAGTLVVKFSPSSGALSVGAEVSLVSAHVQASDDGRSASHARMRDLHAREHAMHVAAPGEHVLIVYLRR